MAAFHSDSEHTHTLNRDKIGIGNMDSKCYTGIVCCCFKDEWIVL